MTDPTHPCPTCPWRADRAPNGNEIPNFHLDLMRGLAKTVGPDDAFREIFACHWSPFDETACSGTGADAYPCVGYAVSDEGWRNLAIRMRALRGDLDLTAAREHCADINLYPTFEAMMAAFEADELTRED